MLIIALGIVTSGLIWFLISLTFTGALLGGIGKAISDTKPFNQPLVNIDNSGRFYPPRQTIPFNPFPPIPAQPKINQNLPIKINPWNVIRTNDEECRFRRENGVMVKECKKI